MHTSNVSMYPGKRTFKAAGCHGNRDVERHFLLLILALDYISDIIFLSSECWLEPVQGRGD